MGEGVRAAKVNALREGPPPSLRDSSPKSASKILFANKYLNFGFGGGGRGSALMPSILDKAFKGEL